MRCCVALMGLFAGITFGEVAAEPVLAGAYEVKVHIVLPHIDTKDYDFVAHLCVDPGGGWTSLRPLGPGPFDRCNHSAVVDKDILRIHMHCPGANAAFADATYRATHAGFRGRVEINLGGKNMTLAEEQRGRYLGPCR